MKVSSTVAVGLLAASSNAQSTTCAQGLYMLVARGSDEAPGVGRIGVVAGNVSLQIPGSITVALDYPATFDNYLTSEFNGTEEMNAKIVNYVSQCPNGKIALLGYSQVRINTPLLPILHGRSGHPCLPGLRWLMRYAIHRAVKSPWTRCAGRARRTSIRPIPCRSSTRPMVSEESLPLGEIRCLGPQQPLLPCWVGDMRGIARPMAKAIVNWSAG